MKILIVDDSATMRKIQKNQLGSIGVKNILEAANGDEALGVLEKNMPVDIILLDWNMPVMDGFSFLKRVREEAAYEGVKIVMCTSESEKERVMEALKAGANNYIVKPFTPDVLKEKIGIE